MAQVYTTPTLWSVVIIRLLYSNLWVLAKCLEFCGVPYMVLPCFASKHINSSWTLLRAFGPHGLLTVYICVSTPSNECYCILMLHYIAVFHYCAVLISLCFLQVAQIYSACDNPRVKHALFSATLGSGVEEFCHAYFTTPVRIIVGLK